MPASTLGTAPPPALVSRRGLLRASVGIAALTAAGPLRPRLPAAAADEPAPRWPGHRPGKIFLGMSTQGSLEDAIAQTGPIGTHRMYFPWLNNLTREAEKIQSQLDEGRLPWVSFFSPYIGRNCWAEVAAGKFDQDIRMRARMYAGLSGPVVSTYHHEPHVTGLNDSEPGNGTAEEFARAWIRVTDVMRDTADLSHVSFVPILSDWLFNPKNGQSDPGPFLPAALLRKAAFVGLDPYQNVTGQTYADRLPWVLDFLERQGFGDMMLGIGETGACNTYALKGHLWWNACWEWAVENVERMGVISYFNSRSHNFSGNNWLLTETVQKMDAYRASLASAVSCALPK